MIEHVTTHYQTLHTWTGHNARHYDNFNAHAITFIFSQFSMGLTLFVTVYHV